MTHKSFYRAAAAEVAAGYVDNALWIKICADMPQAGNDIRQAKYIQLRADELAVDDAKNKMMEIANRATKIAGRAQGPVERALPILMVMSLVAIALFLWWYLGLYGR